MEEEVKDVPLYSMFGQKHDGAGLSMRKDRPHLRFEIESDDGFAVEAYNWDGESTNWDDGLTHWDDRLAHWHSKSAVKNNWSAN